MHNDDMTLMYGGENAHVDLPKFVIKKGEVTYYIQLTKGFLRKRMLAICYSFRYSSLVLAKTDFHREI